MKNILPLLFLLFSTMIFAQIPRSLIEPIDKTYPFGDDYTGSIYKKIYYEEASVIDEKSGTFDTKLKYNIYHDTMEYSTGSELFHVLKVPTIHIRIDSDYYYYCEFKNQRGISKNGYYILVELNSKYRIYKKLSLDIAHPQSGGSVISVGSASRGSIKTRTHYYLEENNIIMELSSNKKDLLASFSDKENELKKYIKKEKISLRKEDDLIRLIAKYNALKSVNPGPSRSLLSNRAQND